MGARLIVEIVGCLEAVGGSHANVQVIRHSTSNPQEPFLFSALDVSENSFANKLFALRVPFNKTLLSLERLVSAASRGLGSLLMVCLITPGTVRVIAVASGLFGTTR